MNVVILRAVGTARRHWLFTSALIIGVALRVVVQVAYWPALLYIDSVRYLYAESNWDPLGYLVLLWPLLKVGGLALVAITQHLLGLFMAAAIYSLALRWGAKRFVGALAAAPVLFDAYQLQLEQNIMADTFFEAVVLAGLVALLWRSYPRLRNVAVAGLAFGLAAIVREVGLLVVAPTAAYVWLAARGHLAAGKARGQLAAGPTARRLRPTPAGLPRRSLAPSLSRIWRHPVSRPALLCASFAVPVVGYLLGNFAATGRMELAGQGSNLYGRVAAAANCATLRIPSYESALCPTPAARALGVDGLMHNPRSPALKFKAPVGMSSRALRGDFTRQVLLQQPIGVAAAISDDVAGSFSYPRRPGQADTPIFRWQFQTSYPEFPPGLAHSREAEIVRQFGGGRPSVVRPLAAASRAYQLDGGYTPGPALALAGLIGVLGAAGADRVWRRGKRHAGRAGTAGRADRAGRAGAVGWRPAGRADRAGCAGAVGWRPTGRAGLISLWPTGLRSACFLVVATGAVLLVGADIIEFSWRYQLPGLVTLPLAAALGIAALTGRQPSTCQSATTAGLARSRSAAELAAEVKAPVDA